MKGQKMKKIKMMLTAAVLAVTMLFATACARFDASAYVKACLDAVTKGEVEEYMKLIDCTEEEAKQDYEDNLDFMIEEMESLGLSDELIAKYREFYAKLYKQTKYEVLEAEKDGDGFTVDVEIEQITGVFDGVEDELYAAAEKYAQDLVNSGESLDNADINEWTYNKMYEILSDRMDQLTYNEKQTITVHVVLNDGYYEIPEEDYEAIDAAMLDVGDL